MPIRQRRSEHSIFSLVFSEKYTCRLKDLHQITYLWIRVNVLCYQNPWNNILCSTFFWADTWFWGLTYHLNLKALCFKKLFSTCCACCWRRKGRLHFTQCFLSMINDADVSQTNSTLIMIFQLVLLPMVIKKFSQKQTI